MNCVGRIQSPAHALGYLVPELAAGEHASLLVRGITQDSRTVRPGDAFVALRGALHDGLEFIESAAAAGAVIALVDADVQALPDVRIPIVAVSSLASRVSEIAARFHGAPSRAIDVIGVTGTNGKTTCTQLIAQAFSLLGKSCGVIGTLGWGFPGQLTDTGHTTPDATTVQALLASMRDDGATHVAMEVSSHALKQGRAAAVSFGCAVFTNLTHDHLDYHGTLDDYGASKKLLFQGDALTHAVVNLEDAFGANILAALPAHVEGIGYGIGDVTGATVRALDPYYSAEGVRSRVETPWGSGEIRLGLLGRFNLSNALAVLGVLCLHGVSLEEALAVFPLLHPVPGRMQRIAGDRAPLVIVDYAHTPDALRQALLASRQHCRGRLWCVFGCGGDRDRSKRPLMGRIAWENSDELILSSDNPRSENPQHIIDEILTGIPDQGVRREVDRAHAIATAIAEANPGDCVLIAGKGHENYQESNGVRVPFCDATAARTALLRREGGA